MSAAKWEGEILALDLATRMGWAAGPADPASGRIYHGSLRLAPEGSSSGAVFGGLMMWLVERIQVSRPRLVVFEAPVAPSSMAGKTTAAVARRLMGLPAIVEAVTHRMGVETKEATVSDVRRYVLGSTRIKSAEAKKATIQKMRAIGFFPSDDNDADALALHRYMAGYLVPALQVEMSPLFRRELQ